MPAGIPWRPAHNTVVVDAVQQVRYAVPGVHGACTLWQQGEGFQVVRAAAPDMIEGVAMQQYERTIVLVDIDPEAGYLLDIFRVIGGSEHAKFQHSTFGTLTTQGLVMTPAEGYGHGTLMRDFQADPAPAPGWQADWAVEDRYGLLPAGTRKCTCATPISPLACWPPLAQAGSAPAIITARIRHGSPA